MTSYQAHVSAPPLDMMAAISTTMIVGPTDWAAEMGALVPGALLSPHSEAIVCFAKNHPKLAVVEVGQDPAAGLSVIEVLALTAGVPVIAVVQGDVMSWLMSSARSLGAFQVLGKPRSSVVAEVVRLAHDQLASKL